jgi:DNA invertase Pin-like site-specific DNA recombinase
VRVAIYLRQSLDAEGTGLAVARQDTACQRYVADRPHMTVVATYMDNDVSATKRRVRPGFAQMLADAKAGEFDLIVAYHLDRLTRTIRDLLPLLELAKEHGVGTTTVSGELDLTTDMGRMLAGILAVVANAEVDRKAARQMLAARQRAEAGQPSPGPRPFGYEPDRVTLRRSEAAVIKHAYKSLLAGATASGIAREMNEKGLTTTFGKPWAHHSVKQMLTNPRYAGLRAHRGEVVGPAVWKPIVDEQTWRAAVAILTNSARRTNMRPGGERTRLLTGIARCGVCDDGTTVLGGSRADGAPTYQCRSGKHLVRTAAAIESAIKDVVIARVSAPDARDLLTDPAMADLDGLRDELLAIEARKSAVQAEFVNDDSKSPAWVGQIMAGLEARQAEVESRMVHTNRGQVLGDLVGAADPEAIWDAMPLTRRRAVVGMLLDITIKKGKVGGNSRNGARLLDPSTIDIRPRTAA